VPGDDLVVVGYRGEPAPLCVQLPRLRHLFTLYWPRAGPRMQGFRSRVRGGRRGEASIARLRRQEGTKLEPHASLELLREST